MIETPQISCMFPRKSTQWFSGPSSQFCDIILRWFQCDYFLWFVGLSWSVQTWPLSSSQTGYNHNTRQQWVSLGSLLQTKCWMGYGFRQQRSKGRVSWPQIHWFSTILSIRNGYQCPNKYQPWLHILIPVSPMTHGEIAIPSPKISPMALSYPLWPYLSCLQGAGCRSTSTFPCTAMSWNNPPASRIRMIQKPWNPLVKLRISLGFMDADRTVS